MSKGEIKWNPPETAPKNRAVLITTAGPNFDLVAWDEDRECFVDYFHKQRIAQQWPYMIAWADVPDLAKVGDSEAETRRLNGWPPTASRSPSRRS